MKRVVSFFISILLAVSAHAAETGQVKAVTRVVLREAVLPSPAAVRDRLQPRIGSEWPITRVETDGKSAMAFRVAEGTVLVTLAPGPVPDGELARACRQARAWKGACEAVTPHKAHLVVSVMDTPFDKVGAALLLTQAVAALLDSNDNAIASYWGESLQSREAFLQQSENATRDKLPLTLWLQVRLSNHPQNGLSISTSGLRAFGLLEVEGKDVKADAQQLYALVLGMANYVLTKGQVINDGDTIGEAVQSIVVRIAPSYWTAGERVCRVVYPGQ